MLQLRDTRIVHSLPEAVLSSITIDEEGQALVYVKEDGETKVKPSTGAAGEIFAGVSYSRSSYPAALPNVEEGLVVPEGLTLTLARTPISGQLRVTVDGTAKTVGSGVADANTKVQSVAGVLTFHADAEGKTVTAQYLYAPSVVEARAAMGEAPVGGLASTAMGVIGALKDAYIGTNFFDATADWSSALYAKLADGGLFTVGTANDHIPGVVVKNAPSAANPFLVLSIKVA